MGELRIYECKVLEEEANCTYREWTKYFGENDHGILPPELLESSNPILRYVAADLLNNHFDKIDNAQDLLGLILNDTHTAIQSSGLKIVGKYFGKISQAEALITQYLNNEQPEIRCTAVNALCINFEQIPDAEDLLMAQTAASPVEIRKEVARSTYHHINNFPTAKKVIDTLGNDPDPEVRTSVLWLIDLLKEKLCNPLDLLIQYLEDEEESIRTIAADALWSAAHSVLDANQVAQRFMSNSFPEVRRVIVRLVESRGEEIENPLKIITKALDDPAAAVKLEALRVIGKRPQFLLTCEGLIETLCKDNNDLVKFTAEQLKKATPTNSPSQKS